MQEKGAFRSHEILLAAAGALLVSALGTCATTENPGAPALDASVPVCADLRCEPPETCSSCPGDCGECPASPAEQAPAKLVTTTAEADTYVRSGSGATLNYGAEPVLKVGLEADGSAEGSAVRFRVGAVGAFTSARLRLYVKDGAAADVDVAALSDSSWDEATATWATMPSVDGPVVATLSSLVAETWVEVDVTPAVRANKAVSFALVPRSGEGAVFASRESAARSPQLVLALQPESPCGNGRCGPGETCANCAVDCACPPATDVLFIGNSYTFMNDLPGMLEELAHASGRATFHQESVTVGGASLESHWGDGNSAAVQRIASRRWSHVVLQEYSLRPIENREQFFKYARLFDERIRATGAKTVFYLTWPRQWAPQNQAVLTDAYRTIALELGAMVAPVGPAWAAAQQADPGLALYEPDGSHATPTGTYLGALVFFGKLFAEDPEGLPAKLERGGVPLIDLSADPARVERLQDAAWTTVYGFSP